MPIATTTKPGNKYRSIQNPRQYRALRRRGYSKAEAARISNGRTPGHTVKAPNYSAKRGQTIAGNLKRGDDGKFASAGKPSAPKKPRAPRKPKAPKQTPAQRAQAKRTQRQANEALVGREAGLKPNVSDALMEFASPTENITLAPANREALEKAGLVETGPDGQPRISSAGRAYVNAARAGDVSRARDALSRANERKTTADARQAARAKRDAERAARTAERERKRAEAEAAKLEKKPGGGGGGGKEKPSKPARVVGGTLGTRAEQLALAQQFARKGFAVFKDKQGHDRWLAISSTAYRDRDGEIVSRAALTQAVKAGDASGQRGPLRYWHVPGLDIGDCDYQATAQDGRFLIESGTFRRPAYAQALKQRGGGYQMSIGFVHPATQPDAAGVFSDIAIFERSVVPPGRASNPFTRITTKESRMLDPNKLAALKQLLGPDAVGDLLAQVETTDKSAQDQGVAYKSDDAPTVYLGPDGTPGVIQDGRFVALKAAPPFVKQDEDEAAVVEDEAKADPMAEDPMTEAPADEAAEGGAYFTPEELQEIVSAVAPAVAAAVVEQLMPALNMEAKMGKLVDEFKAGFTTQLARKDATDAERAAQVAALEQQLAQTQAALKELTGDQPAPAPVRPSSREDNVLPAALTEQALKSIGGHGPVDDIAAWLTGQTA
jgi:hypothetical protein